MLIKLKDKPYRWDYDIQDIKTLNYTLKVGQTIKDLKSGDVYQQY